MKTSAVQPGKDAYLCFFYNGLLATNTPAIGNRVCDASRLTRDLLEDPDRFFAHFSSPGRKIDPDLQKFAQLTLHLAEKQVKEGRALPHDAGRDRFFSLYWQVHQMTPERFNKLLAQMEGRENGGGKKIEKHLPSLDTFHDFFCHAFLIDAPETARKRLEIFGEPSKFFDRHYSPQEKRQTDLEKMTRFTHLLLKAGSHGPISKNSASVSKECFKAWHQALRRMTPETFKKLFVEIDAHRFPTNGAVTLPGENRGQHSKATGRPQPRTRFALVEHCEDALPPGLIPLHLSFLFPKLISKIPREYVVTRSKVRSALTLNPDRFENLGGCWFRRQASA